MKRAWQTVLGVLSALPVLSLLPLALLYEAPAAGAVAGPDPVVLPSEAAYGLLVAMAGTGLGLLLYAFYLVWIVRTTRMSLPLKAGWVVALSVAGLIAMPALWFLHVREERAP